MDQAQKKRNIFTKIEDEILYSIKIENPDLSWDVIAEKLIGRNAKQCKERWINKLCPTIKKGIWSKEEDIIIMKFVAELGTTWRKILRIMNGRCENDIKNRWYTYLSKMKKENETEINENKTNLNEKIIQKSEKEILKFDFWSEDEDEEQNLLLFGSKDYSYESLFYN
jgi:hypothetical protein